LRNIRRLVVAAAAACTLALGFVGGVVVAERFFRVRPPDLSDDDMWALTRVFIGSLEPNHPVVRVRVFVFDHADGFDQLMQNRIEIDTGKGTAQYMWPVAEYAAHWSEVLDLDNNGRKEFVLVHAGRVARVVSYRQSHFAFNQRRDEILSPGGAIELVDIDRDGSPEFVTFTTSKTAEELIVTEKTEYFPKIFRWSEEQGFHSAPESLAGDYMRWRSKGR
jgi:hypothetical protein